MLAFLATSDFNSSLVAARGQPRPWRSSAGMGSCTRRRDCSGFRECRRATAHGSAHVAPHDAHLWALSPGGQRAHAMRLVAALVPGIHVQGFGPALLGVWCSRCLILPLGSS